MLDQNKRMNTTYNTAGTKQIIIQITQGTFSLFLGEPVVRCATPPIIPHGSYEECVYYQEQHVGAVCTAVCDENFMLHTTPGITCQTDLTWNSTLLCQRKRYLTCIILFLSVQM